MTPASAPTYLSRFGRLSAATAVITLVSGCATVTNPDVNDPFESYNRAMDKINYNVDHALIKPIANTYKTLTPEPARTCVANMFNNMEDLWAAANSFLQGRPHDFFNGLGRVLFNTTMGLGGCIDVASKNGSKRIKNDLGTTLGVWGIGSGPYVVLPLLGPSNIRDGTARLGGFASGISDTAGIMSIEKVRIRNSVMGMYFIDMRTGLLDAEELVNDIAIDRYSFVRDAYIQRRQSIIDSKRRAFDDSSYGNDLPDYDDFNDDDATTAPVK